MEQHAVPILRALVDRPRVLGVERELGILIFTLTFALVVGMREPQAAIAGLLLLWLGAALTAYDADLLRILKRMRGQADLYVPY
jgi:type IV secretory pathway TrbD component